MSAQTKILYYLTGVPHASKYDVRNAVNSWQDRHYDEAYIDRKLRKMTEEQILQSAYWNKKMWYRVNAKENSKTA